MKEVSDFSKQIAVDTTNAVILARQSFSINGATSMEIGPSAFLMNGVISQKVAEIIDGGSRS